MDTYKRPGYVRPSAPITLNDHGSSIAALLKPDRIKIPLESLPDLIQGVVLELGSELQPHQT
jgi:hypothetical protein